MFVARNRELSTLTSIYRQTTFSLVILSGRRRIGKTALINEFIRDKAAILFVGMETDEKQNIRQFRRCIDDIRGKLTQSEQRDCARAGIEPALFPTLSDSFEAALEAVFRSAETRKMVLVLDEYPHAARSVKGLASALKELIRRYREKSQLMLILCGPSTAFMDETARGLREMLPASECSHLRVPPLDFWEACRYFGRFSHEDKALAYGMAGGVPQYLLQLNDAMPMEYNIKNTWLDPASAMYQEPGNLLKQEVREPALYNGILGAIAAGAVRLSQISDRIGEDTGVCATYMKTLIALGIVSKETPYGEDSVRKTVYAVQDPLFRFWYRFMPDNLSLLARGAADLVYRRIVPGLPDYMEGVFRDLCIQYLWLLRRENRSAVPFTELGQWWGLHPRTREPVRIPLMGAGKDGSALFGECRWNGGPVGPEAVDRLMERSSRFPYEAKHYYLFAKAGFTEECVRRAWERGSTTLVSYGEMLKG